jgi:regulator of replication initiation timing
MRLVAAVLAALHATGGTAAAQQDQEDSAVVDEMRQMREQLESLADENRRMQSEINELRAANDEDWLTEKRAEEIRSLVNDVLADADVRANLLQNGMMAGWSDHFFLASADGRFKLQLEGQLQVRWIGNYVDHPAEDNYIAGFENTRSKLTLSGHVFSPDLQYLVRTDATRNEPGLVNGLFFLRDAWVRYNLNNEFSIRFGQFKVPFNREELVASQYQLAVERSIINENMNAGRTQGVELTFATDFQKIQVAFDDGSTDSLGGFNAAGGNPVNTAWSVEDVEWAVQARYEHLIAGSWDQFKDFTSPPGDEFGMLFGFAGHAQKDESNGQPSFGRNETRWYGLTGDLSMEWGGASAFAQAIYHYFDTPNLNANVWGVVVQAGVYITPKVELYGRWEYGWWDVGGVEFPDANLFTVGGNWYIDGHDVKFTADFGIAESDIVNAWDADIAGWRDAPRGSRPQVVIRTQFQLLF